MKRMKYTFAALVGMLFCFSLAGCSEKVVTVAEIMDEEGEVTEYIKMQEFELKEVVEDSGKEQVEHCVVLIPGDYHESEEVKGLYLHERAPMESSNIYYSMVPGEAGHVKEELTAEQYALFLEEALKQEGKDVSVEITSFEKVQMDQIPALKIRSSYKVESNTILQLTYIVLAEDTHIVTYSQSKDDEMMADFEAAEGQIRLVRRKE